jgi:hypothetical protein
MATEPTRCGCPGPYNVIARDGACTTCGIEGPDRSHALRDALASKNPKPLMAEAREAGRREGYRRGVEAGRLQAVEALAEREVEQRPFEREKVHEMEIGA